MIKQWLKAGFFTSLIFSGVVDAAIPKFGLAPLSPTVLQVPSNASSSVSYLVRNNTSIPRMLTMQPLPGIAQVVNAGTCSNPFYLNPGQTCVLALQVNGSQLPVSGIHDGPVICKTYGPGNNSPDPFLCSRPSALEILNISVVAATSGHLLWLYNGVPVTNVDLLTDTSGNITLSNTGINTVTNLQISIPAPYNAYFSNGCGASLLPNSSCNISYNIPSPVFSNNFVITATGLNADNSPLPLSVEIGPVGPVQCWGENNTGQLGNGTTTPPALPVTSPADPLSVVLGITNATEISGGSTYTCALLATRQVQCWGANNLGQLGNGAPLPGATSLTAVNVVGINTAVDISAGETHACAVLANGTVQCWGANNVGQLGNGLTTNSSTPVTVAGITNAVEVSAGFYHTCAVLANGQVSCWGGNDFGQLGNGTTAPLPQFFPAAPVIGVDNAIAITTSSFTSCALLANTQVKCWGVNNVGQVGMGQFSPSVPTPTTVVGVNNVGVLSGITDLSGRGFHTTALGSNGLVYAWGLNNAAQLGNGTLDNSPFPTMVLGISAPAIDVSSGLVHACALLINGQMQCWGKNEFGQLGLGNAPPPPSVPPDIYTSAQTVLGLTNGIGLLEHGSAAISCAIVS